MANRVTGFGLSKEVSDRINAKYSDEDEAIVVSWICAVTGSDPPAPGRKNVHEWLKDGHVLCCLINTIKGPPNVCSPHNVSNIKLAPMKKNKEMENISMFLLEAEKLGMKKGDLFQTVDLYEDQNMPQVFSTMYKLSGVAMGQGFTGAQIGVKEASKNQRDFDEQKLREGRNVIGLQMGTNQVASQKGMTAYGLGRQLTPSSK